MIEWGAGAGELDHLTFSVAMTVTPLSTEQQREVLTEVLRHELNKNETMMAVQALRRDPSKTVSEAVAVALTIRPVKIEHEILIGSFGPESRMASDSIPDRTQRGHVNRSADAYPWRRTLSGQSLREKFCIVHFPQRQKVVARTLRRCRRR